MRSYFDIASTLHSSPTSELINGLHSDAGEAECTACDKKLSEMCGLEHKSFQKFDRLDSKFYFHINESEVDWAESVPFIPDLVDSKSEGEESDYLVEASK